MVGKLALFVAPTLIANLLNITFSNFEIKADCCCNSRGTDRHTDQSKYASGCVFLWNDAGGGCLSPCWYGAKLRAPAADIESTTAPPSLTSEDRRRPCC